MKKRIGFVSNSSSSSFVIDKNNLSTRQIKQIFNHIEVGKEFSLQENYNGMWETKYGPLEGWEIEERDGYISGYTSMDNFDMRDFLADIGVYLNSVQWERD